MNFNLEYFLKFIKYFQYFLSNFSSKPLWHDNAALRFKQQFFIQFLFYPQFFVKFQPVNSQFFIIFFTFAIYNNDSFLFIAMHRARKPKNNRTLLSSFLNFFISEHRKNNFILFSSIFERQQKNVYFNFLNWAT